MKTSIVLLLLVLLGLQPITAQEYSTKGAFGEQDWSKVWTVYNPDRIDYPTHDKVISGVIKTDMTLSSEFVYLLSGVVYVANNATLTIEPGTIVRCSNENTGALVITRGAKIKAAGTRLRPIVFTSDKSAGERRTGDWGGISIQGNAPINTLSGNAFAEGELLPAFSIYGGDDVNDDSGVFKFVRIEFAGQKVNATKEMNGLSLCGVGAKTIVENKKNRTI